MGRRIRGTANRMLGRSGHSSFFCLFGRKCGCESWHRVKGVDTRRSRRQLRKREAKGWRDDPDNAPQFLVNWLRVTFPDGERKTITGPFALEYGLDPGNGTYPYSLIGASRNKLNTWKQLKEES